MAIIECLFLGIQWCSSRLMVVVVLVQNFWTYKSVRGSLKSLKVLLRRPEDH